MRRGLGWYLATVSLVACGTGGTERTVAEPLAPAPTTVRVEPPVAETDATSAPDGTVVSQTAAVERSITVGGVGAEYGTPVRCIVDIGVDVRRSSVREASQDAAAAAGTLVDALAAAGVPSSGIQTSNFWINPVYDQYTYPIITGYEVSIGYRVTMPDVNSVGAVLAGAIEAGGDSVRASSVRFEADPTALMSDARATAWTDVRARAEATAALIGEPLGQVLDVHEKVLITSSQGMMQGGEGDSASFDIPVSPGVAGVTVLLTVTYAIGA